MTGDRERFLAILKEKSYERKKVILSSGRGAAFAIRKEPKKHGPSQWVEGMKNLRPGMRVAIVEDVVTTGASTLRAIERAEGVGLVVSRVLCIVDRNEGGAEFLSGRGYRLV